MKKLLKTIKLFFRGIWIVFDKRLVIPVTKLVISMSSKWDKSGKQVENFMSKKNTILFISLFLSIIIFVIVDQRVLVFTDSSAEVLRSQAVTALYNEESYVVEGLPKTVDITLIGSKADLYFAKQSPSHDITVDLSYLKPGTHRVNINYSQALPSIDYKVNPSTATIIIYPKISESRTFSVDVINQDSLDEKLVIDDISIATDRVVIKGAEHQLNKVASVKALLDIRNLTKQEVGLTTLREIPLRAYDDRGNVVDVELVPSRIEADINIESPSKELPIRVVPKGDLAFGKAISSIVTNVTSVTVYGEEAALANLTYLPIEISVDEMRDDQQFKLEIPKPVGVKSLSANNITINVALGDSIDKEVEGVKIEYRNLNEDVFAVRGSSAEDTEVTVLLKGVEPVLDQITADNISAIVDLRGLGEGTHEVDVTVEGADPKVVYTSKTLKVRLTISRK